MTTAIFNLTLNKSYAEKKVSLKWLIKQAHASDEVNPDCPNGCIEGITGCYCYGYWLWYAEYPGWN